MSKYCTNCGTQLEDEDLFCYQCGKPQEVDIQPDNTPVKEEPVPASTQTDNSTILEESIAASSQAEETAVQEDAVPTIQAEDTTILEQSVDASCQDDSTTTLEETVDASSEDEITTILEEPVATAIQAEDTTILEEPAPTINQADVTLIVDETAPTFNQPEGLDTFSHTPTSKPNKNLNTWLISAGIIVLAAVGSYFVTSNLKPANKADDTNDVIIEKEVQPEDEIEKEKAEKLEKEQQQKERIEAYNFDMIKRQYELFGEYDQRIAQCATDFNNKYLDSSITTRNELAYECANLKLDIDFSVDDLNALEIDTSSKYYSDYQNMLELAECLQKRISVISEAWDLSIEYGSSAKNHTDEICAPLARDKGPNGNVYYQKFKELYPNVKPTEK